MPILPTIYTMSVWGASSCEAAQSSWSRIMFSFVHREPATLSLSTMDGSNFLVTEMRSKALVSWPNSSNQLMNTRTKQMKTRKLSLRTCRRWTKKTHCRWWQMVLTQALLSLLPLPWNRRWLENHPGNWSKKRHVPLDVSVLIYGRRIYGLVEMAGTGLCSSVYWLLRRWAPSSRMDGWSKFSRKFLMSCTNNTLELGQVLLKKDRNQTALYSILQCMR